MYKKLIEVSLYLDNGDVLVQAEERIKLLIEYISNDLFAVYGGFQENSQAGFSHCLFLILMNAFRRAIAVAKALSKEQV